MDNSPVKKKHSTYSDDAHSPKRQKLVGGNADGMFAMWNSLRTVLDGILKYVFMGQMHRLERNVLNFISVKIVANCMSTEFRMLIWVISYTENQKLCEATSAATQA